MKIVIVGSSPVMLLKAILLRHQHKNAKIEIHEKGNSVGGSWKTTTFQVIKSVETGSHIFAPWKNKVIYNQCLDILRKKFKLKTYFLKTKPLNIINYNIKKNELKKIKYFYIKGGSGELLNSLIKHIKKNKIKIKYKSKIEKIFLKDNKNKLQSNGGVFLADQVYLPYYCKFNLNSLYGRKTYSLKNSIHILIKFSSRYQFKKKVSYIQKVSFSKLFDRLSNISSIFNVKDHIFSLRLSENAKKKFQKNKKIPIDKIQKDLVNFLKPKFKNDKLLKAEYKLCKYEISYRNNKQLQQLKEFTKKHKIKLVDTSEFIKYMSKNINELRAL